MTTFPVRKLRLTRRPRALAAALASLAAGGLAGSGLLGGAAGAAASGPEAHAARTVYLREYASLRFTSDEESTLYERGHASGTFPGGVAAHLTLNPGHVEAVFTIYPKGGSVTGKAQARFVVRGAMGYYGGTLKIVKGTGIFRHATGNNIGISGTIVRHEPFTLTVKAQGWVKY